MLLSVTHHAHGLLHHLIPPHRCPTWSPVNKPRHRKSGPCLQDVEEAISALQKELFRRQGIDGDWGLHCLGRINTEHRGDADFMAAFYDFVTR